MPALAQEVGLEGLANLLQMHRRKKNARVNQLVSAGLSSIVVRNHQFLVMHHRLGEQGVHIASKVRRRIGSFVIKQTAVRTGCVA